MKIRHARPEDDKAIREMHERMRLDYELPDLQEMVSKLIFEDDAGAVRMAILLRPTVEAYMFMDRSEEVSPRERWSRFLCMHKAAMQDAASRGIKDAYAFLPPHLDRSFGRKLKRLGWFRPWDAWNRILNSSHKIQTR